MSIKRLLRESNPPAGMLASPVPQYEDVSTGEPGVVKGRDGAPFSMLLGPDGQPIDPSNPLEVRVRELETELQELRQLLQSGDTKVQLTGQNVQVVSPRGIYDGDDINHVFKAPIGATGFSVHATIYGVTGTFDPGEGLGVRLFLLSGDAYRAVRTLAEINSPRVSSGEGNVLIYVGPYDIDETMLHSRVLAHKLINTGMFYPYLRLDLMVNGTFGAGEGFDCEMLLVWHY